MVTDGYSHYECDVATCRAEAYARPGTKEAEAFSQRTRLDSEGRQRTLTLCPRHARAYDVLARVVEAAFRRFEDAGVCDIGRKGGDAS